MPLTALPSAAKPAIDLAARYGITVNISSSKGGVRPLILEEGVCEGPYGHWIDTQRRIVTFETGQAGSHVRAVEVYLHEVVHVIAQPPWWHIDDVPEDFMLLQFERALAKTVLPAKGYRDVVRLQEETQAPLFGDDFSVLGACKNYRRAKPWRTGFAIARCVGLLDKSNRPTFQWPRWWELRPFFASLDAYITSVGEADPWGGKRAPG